MNDASRYRAQILSDAGKELDLYLEIGGSFSRREIDAALDLCNGRGAVASRRLQAALQRVRLREDGPRVTSLEAA